MTPLEIDRRFWDRAAGAYARSKIADAAGYERTMARAAALLPADGAVVELGCGTGMTALRLAPHAKRYLATDISPAMIAIAEGRFAGAPVEGLRFEATTADRIKPPAGGFDAALAFNFLHLVTDLDATLSRIAAMLKPGALFLSKTICLREMNPLFAIAIPAMRAIGKAPSAVLRFSRGDLIGAVERADFAVEGVELHASKGKDRRPFLIARRR